MFTFYTPLILWRTNNGSAEIKLDQDQWKQFYKLEDHGVIAYSDYHNHGMFHLIIPQNKQLMNICNILFLDNDHDTGFNNI